MCRVRRVLPAFFVGVLLLTACSRDDGSPGAAVGAFPLTVDNCGREVTFEGPPERVMTQ